MADREEADPHPELTRLVGPCPFSTNDPRYESWIAGARIVWEQEAQLKAALLSKAETASPEEMRLLLIEGAVGGFNLLAGFAAAAVNNYTAAAQCERGLKQMAADAVRKFRARVDASPIWMREGEPVLTLQNRLAQRVAHYMTFALAFAREAAEKASVPTVPNTPAEPTPEAAAIPKLLNRAAWLNDRLVERGWTAHDLERFNGPNWRTTRRIQAGEPVRDSVLEKLVIGLSSKGRVTLDDVPGD